MAQKLSSLELDEISGVDRPANATRSVLTGDAVPRARVALLKRDSAGGSMNEQWDDKDPVCKAVDGQTVDGTIFPASDFAYVPDKTKPSTWKLRLTSTPGGKPDPGIVGAAAAALGPGFRGKKVQIPADARAAVVARVRSAWRQANPDKDEDEMPSGIKKGESNMTLQEIQKQVEAQEQELKVAKADAAAANAKADLVKAENDTILKMSKKERKLYNDMSAEKRKEYMAADAEKRKSMMDDCDKARKEAKLKATMSKSEQAEFEKADAAKRDLMLKAAEAKEKAKGKKKDDEDDDEDDNQPADPKMKKRLDEQIVKAAEADDRVAKAESRLAKAEGELSEIRKAKRKESIVNKLEKEASHMSGTFDETADVLLKLAETHGEDSDIYKRYFDALKNESKANTLKFSEVGKVGGGPVPAEKLLEAKAQEIAKRDHITVEKAMSTAVYENPDLYFQADAERRQKVAQR